MRSMPSTSRLRACGRSRASRCRARCGCNGGATCSMASAPRRRARTRSRRRCSTTVAARAAAARAVARTDRRAARSISTTSRCERSAELESYCKRTSGNVLASAARILDPAHALRAELPARAGIAVALTALLRAFPLHASRRQLYVPLAMLARHAGACRGRATPGAAAPALLRRARGDAGAGAPPHDARPTARRAPRAGACCRHSCRSRWCRSTSSAWNAPAMIPSDRDRSPAMAPAMGALARRAPALVSAIHASEA